MLWILLSILHSRGQNLQQSYLVQNISNAGAEKPCLTQTSLLNQIPSLLASKKKDITLFRMFIAFSTLTLIFMYVLHLPDARKLILGQDPCVIHF